MAKRSRLHLGDALEVMRTLPSDSFDAMLTDPPAGIGFMGKSWDANKGGRDEWIAWLAAIMREAYRCLKPGAHGLVWALPRTSHWTAMALEDAGFEIRDSVFHLFGSGFPKSLNASIAIDKMNGDERPVVGVATSWNNPTSKVGAVRLSVSPGTYNATASASATSAAFEGFGTALKPAAEVWWLIRKPVLGTVAANLLEHGTGCLAIDACRIGANGGTRKGTYPNGDAITAYGNGLNGACDIVALDAGRWPAHLILDEEAGRILDAQAGAGFAQGPQEKWAEQTNQVYGDGVGGGPNGARFGDSGGPSRFFYTAKCSTSERNLGCDDLPIKQMGSSMVHCNGTSDTRIDGAPAPRARNVHPTVKSSSLTRWLARLIKPPGDNRRLLNPFTGSGGEAIGAILEGYAHVECIERDPEYFEIAKRRIAHAEENPRAWESDADRSPDDVLPGQIPLFGDAK